MPAAMDDSGGPLNAAVGPRTVAEAAGCRRRQAAGPTMEEDYLISASESLLLEHGLSLHNCQAKELRELIILNLSKLLLKDVTPLQYCTALKCCTLANNHITDISALRGCDQLIKLDLHGNQIQSLPGQEFWRELKDLKLLYLHNNRLRGVSNIEALSSCPGLVGLTLYDTPLSLHRNYRHIVVNSVWSLKALDHFVISDEEIIEDWTLQGRFKALSPELRVNLLPAPSKEISTQKELQDINGIITKINRILAACSPLLIVQKWIRGHLVRRSSDLISQPEAPRTKLHSKRRGSQEKEVETDGAYVGTILRDNSSALPANSRRLAAIKQPGRRVNNTPDAEPLKQITVDLWKIQKDVLQVLPEAEIAPDLRKPGQLQPAPIVSDYTLNKEHKEDIKITEHKETDQMPTKTENKTEFSLLGQKTKVYESHPSKNLLNSINTSAEDIRTSIQRLHSAAKARGERPPCLWKDPVTRRPSSQPSPSLTPLTAIDKAYETREKLNQTVQKRNVVRQVYTDKQKAKYHREEFLEARIKQATAKSLKDSDILQQRVQQNLLSEYEDMDRVRYRKRMFLQEKEARRRENAFAKEFNTQHTSVTKTLLRHDRLIRAEEVRQEKIKAVQSLKEDREEQRKFIKCLQEHRQLVLQMENASEKAAVESLILQQANSRLQEAQAHVSTMNIQYSTVEAMDKVPVTQPVAKDAMIAHYSLCH